MLVLFVMCFLFFRRTGWESLPRLPIAESLLSIDSRPQPICRIDSDGIYQQWEGVTIIMPANITLNLHTYRQSYSVLYNRFSDILTPLPFDSYHITLSSIASRDHFNSLINYNQHIHDSRPRLEAVKQQLVDSAARRQHNPDAAGISSRLAFTVSDVHFGPIAVTLTMMPQSAEVTDELHRIIALIEPTLGPLYQRQTRWHMTMAYRKFGLEVGEVQAKAVQDALMEVYRGVEVVVLPPVLCAFYDMRQFRPI